MTKFVGEDGGRFDVEWARDVRFVRVGRFLVPAAFEIRVRSPLYPVAITVEIRDGTPQCTGVSTIEHSIRLDDGSLAPAGPPITGDLLRRLPLRRLMVRAVQAIALDAEPRQLPGGVKETLVALRQIGQTPSIDPEGTYLLPARTRAGGTSAVKRGFAPRPPLQRGKRLDSIWLQRAANTYRDALQDGVSPTKAVFETYPISRSTAGRWISEARKRGLLGDAPGKRIAGER